MKPEAALNSWRQWQCALKSRPNMVMRLAGGETNQSYLLESDDRKMVMRQNAPVDDLPGVDRANELVIWEAAANDGLAPAVLYSDDQAGFLVTEYIDGGSLAQFNLDSAFIDRLVNLLSRVHAIDVKAPLLDYAAHIEKFWRLIEARQTLDDSALLTQRKAMRERVAEFGALANIAGLCHHDPTSANIVEKDNHLYLLDWEYAARGFVAMDYAALSVEWGIDSAEIIKRVALEPALLETAKTIYLYICRLWQEIRS